MDQSDSKPKAPEAGYRLISMLADHAIMSSVMGVISVPIMIIVFAKTFSAIGEPKQIDQFNPFEAYLQFSWLLALAFGILMNKDGIKGRSPAKLLFKFQTVVAKTGEPAGPIRCMIRNITLFLWPIEGIFALANPSRRLGDFLAGTRIDYFDSEKHHGDINWVPLVVAVLLPSAAYYLLFKLWFGLIASLAALPAGTGA